MIVEANTRAYRWTNPNGSRCSFEPEGPQHVVGRPRLENRTMALRNPVEWDDAHNTEMLAARLFVGLSVGQKPTWSVDDVVDIVLAVLSEQANRGRKRKEARHVDASFIVQRGLYTSRRTGAITRENSVQVVLLNLDELPQRRFADEVVELADQLVYRLEQEEVVVDMQKDGVSFRTIGVKP